jgi:hypothetical protein
MAATAWAPLSRAQDSTKETSKPDQTAGTAAQRRAGAQAQFENMATQLKLSDDQKAKLKPIVQEEAKKLREIRQDTAMNTQEKRAKVRELRDEYTAKIKPVLTAEQFDQYKKLRDQAPARRSRNTGDSGQATSPDSSKSTTAK